MDKHALALATAKYAAWGDVIAKEYVDNGVPLADGIKKVASEHSLNPEQIRRVAEAANRSTYNALLPTRENGDVRFDVVQPEQVIKEHNAPEKVAAISITDYNTLPKKPLEKIANISAFPQQVIGTEMEKIASEREDREYLDHNQVIAVIQDLTKEAKDLQLQRVGVDMLQREETDKLAEIVRRMVVEGNDADLIYKAAVQARPDQQEKLADLFGGIFSDLAQRGYLKVGKHTKLGAEVPKELISSKLKSLTEGVPLQVINGRHPIFLSIDTIAKQEDDKKKADRGEKIVQEKLRKAKRALTSMGGL